jgi:hypothetical protein
MKTRLLAILVIAFVCANFQAHAQVESNQVDHPYRIGIKLGVPNITGLGIEYVTPLLDSRLSAAVDFSYIPLSISSDYTGKLKFTYWSIGANYYFFRPGKGLYGGLSTGGVHMKFDITKVENGETGTGSASVNVGYPLLAKIGVLAGGRVYFRAELGYGIASFPSTVNVNVKYSGKTEVESVDVPSAIKIPVAFNIGVGVAF